MPTPEEDRHFAEQALRLAGMASGALEEAEQYAKLISDEALKDATLNEIERIMETS